MRARQVAAAAPWRKTRSARGQVHYAGYFWSATMGAHVVYESRLKLARLLLADFDRHVAVIAAQPFLQRARVGGARPASRAGLPADTRGRVGHGRRWMRCSASALASAPARVGKQ